MMFGSRTVSTLSGNSWGMISPPFPTAGTSTVSRAQPTNLDASIADKGSPVDAANDLSLIPFSICFAATELAPHLLARVPRPACLHWVDFGPMPYQQHEASL
jgi:hypothetical protein